MALEIDVRYRIERILENKGWKLDPDDPLKNVYFESSLPKKFSQKLEKKRPDFTFLYKENQSDSYIPIGVIEAKKPGEDLEKALDQGTEYAMKLDAPLVFAINGTFCKTRHIKNSKNLYLNGQEVKEILRVKDALGYLAENTNDLYTIPKEVIRSREDMISLFGELNNVLRGEGLRAGIERFSEFANVLFLKLLSEHNESSVWTDIKRLQSKDRIGYINKIILNYISTQYGGDVFSPLLIKKPSTLDDIIERLDPLHLTPIDEDIKGSAFEYFLEKTTSTQNDLGEYFTPRHIIKSMVNLVNPRFGETVYDPFCGTGGFLTASFNYMRELLQCNEAALCFLKTQSIWGREITTTSRIAKMNMILHGDGHAGVSQVDSLENPVQAIYDIVLTNIPFSQKISTRGKGGKLVNDVTNKYYDGLGKNSGDAVCILHCFKSLKNGGRMAAVVPEGFLFRRELKFVRQFLLEHSSLHSIISLPQGCFLPYTGVKTDILYFTNVEQQDTKRYWYFNVKNDGFTLDNNRRKIDKESDIDKINASSVRDYFYSEQEMSLLRSLGFSIIIKDEIETASYNLLIKHENERVCNYEMVHLREICTLIRGVIYSKKDRVLETSNKRILTADNIAINGMLVLETAKHIYLNDFTIIENDKKLRCNDIFICLSSGSKKHVGKVAYIKEDINCYAGGFMAIVRPSSDSINPFYLYCVLNGNIFKNIISNRSRGTNINNLSNDLLDIMIPLPSIEKQLLIIKEIKRNQKNIEELKKTMTLCENKIVTQVDELWQDPACL